MDAYFIGETNEIYEAYLFNQRVQEVGESFESFLTSVPSLAKTCNFGTMQDRMIRETVVVGIKDNTTRKKLLAESKLTLNKCIDICRASETTSKQLKEMTQLGEVSAILMALTSPIKIPWYQNTTGHPKFKTDARDNKGRKVSRVQHPVQNKPYAQGNRASKPPFEIRCKFCHRNHPRKKELCPAWQHKCDKCGGVNHFSVACSSLKPNKQQGKKSVHSTSVQQEFSRECNDGGSDEYLFSVESLSALHKKNSPKKIYANMRLRDVTVTFQLDCGATVNILPVDIYQQIFKDPQMKRLQHTQTTLVMFNKSERQPLGYVKVETLNPKNEQCFLMEYTVVPEGYTPLLGSESVQQFCLITVNADIIVSIAYSLYATGFSQRVSRYFLRRRQTGRKAPS